VSSTRRSPPIPAKWRRNLLITIDGAGSSHAVVEHPQTDRSPGLVGGLRTPDIVGSFMRCRGHAVFDLEVGAGVAGLGGGEFVAEAGDGATAAGRGRGVEPQVQGVAADVDVAGQSHRLGDPANTRRQGNITRHDGEMSIYQLSAETDCATAHFTVGILNVLPESHIRCAHVEA